MSTIVVAGGVAAAFVATWTGAMSTFIIAFSLGTLVAYPVAEGVRRARLRSSFHRERGLLLTDGSAAPWTGPARVCATCLVLLDQEPCVFDPSHTVLDLDASYDRSRYSSAIIAHRPVAPAASPRPATITSGATVRAPITGAEGVAYLVRVEQSAGGPLRLWCAHSAGFDATLDDGTTVRIPPGPLALEPAAARAPRRLSNDLVSAWLTTIGADVEWSGRGPWSRDAWTGYELTLHPGDRVELTCDLDLIPDPRPRGDAYREQRSLLTPRGVPTIRVA